MTLQVPCLLGVSARFGRLQRQAGLALCAKRQMRQPRHPAATFSPWLVREAP
jgi:hypothetical protein